MDEIDCSNFFDGLLDFPEDNNDICGGLLGDNADTFASFWPNPSDILPCSQPGFSHDSTASNLSAELAVPYEEIVHLEWLSNFVEDSFSGASMTLEKVDSSFNKHSSSNQFQIPSPVSVVESSSSSTAGGGKIRPLSPETPTNKRLGRARSKRPRPATFTPRPAIQLLTAPSAIIAPVTTNTAESRESHPLIKMIKIPKPVSDEQKKKKKIKLLFPSQPTGDADMNQNPPSQYVRKCMHCEITKTPQWRAGPMGPKTLCNACGVRHKSGRLFPEYRPAASPTFVPSIHSNSHKKVVEMRSKVIEEMHVMHNPTVESGKTEH